MSDLWAVAWSGVLVALVIPAAALAVGMLLGHYRQLVAGADQ